MKKTSLAALIMAILAALGLRGLTPPALAGLTVVPTLPPFGVSSATRTLPAPSASLTRAQVTPTPSQTQGTALPTRTRTWTPTPSGSTTSTATIGPSSTAPLGTVIPTKYVLALDPQTLSVEALRARTYGGGAIRVTQTIVSSEDAPKRVLFDYPSDGLRITGMMLIPPGPGPFPVVILDHGYFKPAEYKTGDGTVRAADYLARHGYLTLAPDYRCYGGSQCGPNPLYVGYAVDVLNLIASLGTLPNADTSRIGIWGHSMGGGITLRVLVVSRQIKVAALYGALNSDDEVHYCWLYSCPTPAAPTREPKPPPQNPETDPDFAQGLPTPVASAPDRMAKLHEIFIKSSPSRHLGEISASVIIHHGEKDDIVPIEWSVGLAEALTAQKVPATLYTYPGEGHVFASWNWQLFMARTIALFNKSLNPRETPITAEMRVLRQERMIVDSSY